MASLPETKRVLDDCTKHLTDTNTFASPIEVYLARSALITLCAEIELTVAKLIGKRLEAITDLELLDFSRTTSKNVVRNARPGELGKVMEKFGPNCRARFDAHLDQHLGLAGRGRIGNIVDHRDDFNHVTPPPITFREAQQGYIDALELIAAIEAALGVVL